MTDTQYADGGGHPGFESTTGGGRRRFLRQICAGTVAAVGTAAAGPSSPRQAGKLPRIQLGKYNLTRLIAGSNPISGYSHSTRNLADHMREYFTLERTVQFVRQCERMGINTWQTGHGPTRKVADALARLREQGSKVHWLCLAWDTMTQPLDRILALRPIAIVHHGGVTDAMFRKNRADKVHDFVKRVHDAGVMAGVSSHNPRNVAYIEEHAWENDFFMACLYHVSRPAEEIRAKLGTVPLGEPFLESDRDEMTDVVRQVKRPCLAFKILAAGRHCWTRPSVESAFEYAFSRIKKTDGVIVGMYPRFSGEIGHNIELTLRYGRTA